MVHVATDDQTVVKAEIEDLPKGKDGHTLLFAGDGAPTCHRFHFVFTSHGAPLGHHIHKGYGKGSCEERYKRILAAFADLMLLARSNVAMVEFNSNWGRLVRTFPLHMNDSRKVANSARLVLMRGKTKVAWGKKLPGPLGQEE
jgi:hypothetical protein